MNASVKVLAAVLGISTAWGWLALPPAHAEPVRGSDSPMIPIWWDDGTVNLAWDCSRYTTAEGTFVASPVVVPGDRIERTAIVKNAGPSAARVTVQIVDVATLNSSDTVNTDLEDLVHLVWSINGQTGHEVWRDARLAAGPDGVSHAVSFPVEQGGEFVVTVGIHFPVGATGGRNAGLPSSVLSFNVRIVMTGDESTKANNIVKIETGGSAGSPAGIPLGVLIMTTGIALLVAMRLYGLFQGFAFADLNHRPEKNGVCPGHYPGERNE